MCLVGVVKLFLKHMKNEQATQSLQGSNKAKMALIFKEMNQRQRVLTK